MPDGSIEQLIFTDRPRGKGWEPNRAGYQIAACSDGLAKDELTRSFLSAICVHYGSAFQQYAPQKALDAQSEWRKDKTQPQSYLQLFPVIWSYDRIDSVGNQVALTKIQYKGESYDGRPGSFLAHSLLFSPHILGKYADNPFSLTSSGLFMGDYPIDKPTKLESLTEPGSVNPTAPEAQCNLLKGLPKDAAGKSRLPALISALMAARSGPRHRPVVLCLDDWSKAAALCEALLTLLPPAFRRKTTICTYESDRNWIPQTNKGRPTGVAGRHDIIVIYSKENDRLARLSNADAGMAFSVFDFSQNKIFSEFKESPYAILAEHYRLEGKVDKLNSFYTFLQKLSCDEKSNNWDTLAKAWKGTVIEAAGILLKEMQGRGPAVAKEVVQHLLSRIGVADEYLALAKPLSSLMVGVSDTALKESLTKKMRELAFVAIQADRWSEVDKLLAILPRERSAMLLEVLDAWLNRAEPKPPSDWTTAKKLIQEGLSSAKVAKTDGDYLATLFRHASALDCVTQMWDAIGPSHYMPWLKQKWDKKQEDLVWDQLRDNLTKEQFPIGFKETNEQILKQAYRPKQNPELLFPVLKDLACYYCKTSGDSAEKDVRDLLQNCRGLQGKDRAAAFGYLANSVNDKSTEAWLFAEYRKGLKGFSKDHWKIRRRLLNHERTEVLAWDMFADLTGANCTSASRLTEIREWLQFIAEAASDEGHQGFISRIIEILISNINNPLFKETVPALLRLPLDELVEDPQLKSAFADLIETHGYGRTQPNAEQLTPIPGRPISATLLGRAFAAGRRT